MTENEVRKYIEELREKARLFGKSGYATAGMEKAFNKSADTIENLLNELELYRAIGTIEEFKDLKDCGTHDCIIKHLTGECSYKETGCSDCKSKEMIRTAVERMKPKKPDYEGDGYADGKLVYDYAKCPICGHDFEYGINDWECEYCSDCGQKLDWE